MKTLSKLLLTQQRLSMMRKKYLIHTIQFIYFRTKTQLDDYVLKNEI